MATVRDYVPKWTTALLRNGWYPECDDCKKLYTPDMANLQRELDNLGHQHNKERIKYHISRQVVIFDEQKFKTLFKFIDTALDWQTWLERFYNSLKELEFYSMVDGRITMFSVEQMLAIGTSVRKYNNVKYTIYNLLPRLCIYPWELPINIFTHGLCYHGNYGDLPNSPQDAEELLTRNYWEFIRTGTWAEL